MRSSVHNRRNTQDSRDGGNRAGIRASMKTLHAGAGNGHKRGTNEKGSAGPEQSTPVEAETEVFNGFRAAGLDEVPISSLVVSLAPAGDRHGTVPAKESLAGFRPCIAEGAVRSCGSNPSIPPLGRSESQHDARTVACISKVRRGRTADRWRAITYSGSTLALASIRARMSRASVSEGSAYSRDRSSAIGGSNSSVAAVAEGASNPALNIPTALSLRPMRSRTVPRSM